MIHTPLSIKRKHFFKICFIFEAFASELLQSSTLSFTARLIFEYSICLFHYILKLTSLNSIQLSLNSVQTGYVTPPSKRVKNWSRREDDKSTTKCDVIVVSKTLQDIPVQRESQLKRNLQKLFKISDYWSVLDDVRVLF